jgi:hypothetical protein
MSKLWDVVECTMSLQHQATQNTLLVTHVLVFTGDKGVINNSTYSSKETQSATSFTCVGTIRNVKVTDFDSLVARR